MKNKEIVRRIQELQSGAPEQALEVTQKRIKLLVFTLGQRRLAFYAEQVREILGDVPLFFIPFVPPYVRGFINRHGEPYTVIDMNVLFEKSKLASSTFLILNVADDQLAFMISDIQEILQVPESELHHITSQNEHGGFFQGSVTREGREIFILDLAQVLARLEADLELAG